MLRALESFVELTTGDFTIAERRQRVIEVGLRITGYDVGMVTEAHGSEICIWNAVASTGEGLAIEPMGLEDSACGLVVASGEALFLHDVANSEFSEHTGMNNLFIRSYIGVPLMIAGQVSGTLCFVNMGREARTADALSDERRRLLLKMGAWLSRQHEIDAQEAELAKQKEVDLMLSHLFDGMELQASFLKLDGTIVRSNRATLEQQDLNHQDLEGLRVWDAPWVQPADRKALILDVARAASGQKIARLVQVFAPSGEKIDLDYTLKPLKDKSGEVCYLLAEARDVTPVLEERRRKQEFERKLQEGQKLESLGVLAGGIAHDFNNFLTGILGNANLVRAELPAGSEFEPSLFAIEDAARKSADLCQQLLAYSGRSRFVVEPICLNLALEESEHLLRTSISKSSRLTFDLQENLPMIDADLTQIRQIVMNVVMNASEALPGGCGGIRVRTSVQQLGKAELETLSGVAQPGQFVALEISDDGAGMAEETMNQIFEPFFTTKFTGRGLGLAAVLGIVRSHGGVLSVTSRRGEGTKFRFYFPQTTGACPLLGATPKVAVSEKLEGKVLVIDDMPVVRTVAERMLKALGHEVTSAKDGLDGLRKFASERQQIVAVLLDVTMPDVDGFEIYRELQGMGCSAPIILMSGFSETEISERFTDEEHPIFLEKPITLASLRSALERAAVQKNDQTSRLAQLVDDSNQSVH